MDLYKHKIMLAMASTAHSDSFIPRLTKKDAMRCDCTNCRMGKSNKCTTYTPSKSGRGKK
ncbi:MAG: hypothetical protein Unbinned6437contig1000_70 [Prokaryotic dsDNA virus sp.]|nr:MAG: hypothetical protein Unbinned6437contig1000_70 [Prokaryotic dsDNA virus sp.]